MSAVTLAFDMSGVLLSCTQPATLRDLIKMWQIEDLTAPLDSLVAYLNSIIPKL
jgi:hypothetical protein